MRRARTRAALTVVTVLALGLAGCIIRPQGSIAKRKHFDRSHLGDLRLTAAPAGLLGGGAVYDDGIRFDGYTLAPDTLKPGTASVLTLYWQAVDPPVQSWRVFVHLDPIGGQGGRINFDHEPAGGRYPTEEWEKGDVVRDTVRLNLPTWAVARSYELWVGFYQGNQRLDVVNRTQVRTDGQNRVLAGILQVR